MYQLLIVDDEIYTAQAIETGVAWSELGIVVVHVANNNRQAKEVFRHHAIDVMICDIEMPQGTGLELLQWVKIHYPSTEAAFLTCHADFHYAQQAVRLGSIEYMLKPVQFTELRQVVANALDRISRHREKTASVESMRHYRELWTSHQPVLMERFWLDLLQRDLPAAPEAIRSYAAARNLPLDETAVHVPVLIKVQAWHKPFGQRDGKVLTYALCNVAEEMLATAGEPALLIRLEIGAALALLPGPDREGAAAGNLISRLQAYIRYCHAHFYCDMCCYPGYAGAVSELPNRLEELLELDRDNIKQVNRVVMPESELPARPEKEPFPDMSGWLELLNRKAEDELLADLLRYLDASRDNVAIDAQWLRGFYHNFLQTVYHVLQVKGLQAHLIFEDNMEQAREATRSVAHLARWIETPVRRAVSFIREAEQTQTVVDKVKRYIAQHLRDEHLTRDEIAGFVYLNPDYLTRLFKKETGYSISDYLVRERVGIASELLLRTNDSIHAIAVSLGYSNFSHFSRMFKKVTGQSPQEFRQLHRR